MNDPVWIRYYKGGHLEETITFAAADDRIYKRIQELRDAGINARDCVIVQMGNTPDAVVTYMAIYRMNAIVVPVHQKEVPDRFDYMLSHSGARAIVRPNEIVRVNSTTSVDVSNLQDICTIIYTSGSTGEPKGVCLSWNNWMANTEALIHHHEMNGGTVLASPLPLSHCNAHGLAMLTTFTARCTLVLFDKMSDNLLDCISSEKVTILSIVPSILQRLHGANPSWKPHVEFKYILTAAAPLKPDLIDEVLRDWGVRIIQGYGLSESVNFSCTMPIGLSDSEYRSIMFPHPSVGVALEGVHIRVGEEDKERVPGEVVVRAPSNFYGYFKRDTVSPKEWVSTGDIGYFQTRSGRRYYYLVGRIKEFINRGGEKISPFELELEIAKLLPQGETFAVITIPDDEYGEDVGLACTQKIDATLFNSIPKYRRPKKIFLMKDLIYASNGKMLRRKIADFCNAGNAEMMWQTYE